MTVRYFKGRQEFTFEISYKEQLTLTLKTNESLKTFMYNEEGASVIREEIEWLSKHQRGIFRLLYLCLPPWLEVLEVFVYLAKVKNITL